MLLSEFRIGRLRGSGDGGRSSDARIEPAVVLGDDLPELSESVSSVVSVVCFVFEPMKALCAGCIRRKSRSGSLRFRFF